MKLGVRASSSVDVAVGLRLRIRRKEFGMSQTALAQKLGITFQQVQKYENGTNRIGASRLAAVAACLDVPVSYFFESIPAPGGGSPGKVGGLAADLTKADVLELNRAFVAVSDPATRRAVIELMEAIAAGKG